MRNRLRYPEIDRGMLENGKNGPSADCELVKITFVVWSYRSMCYYHRRGRDRWVDDVCCPVGAPRQGVQGGRGTEPVGYGGTWPEGGTGACATKLAGSVMVPGSLS